MKNDTMKIQTEFPLTYRLIKRESKKLIILLHGFAQTNEDMRSSFEDVIPKEYDILIPNGPFPIPKIRKDYIQHRYAWYFYDRHNNSYEIDYTFSSSIVSKLVVELGYDKTQKTVLGYSQGGYLSPFLGLSLKNVTSIIGIACTFKWQYLPESLPFDVYAIHGRLDNLVDYNNSKEHYDIIKNRAYKNSSFITLDNENHEMKKTFILEAAKLL